MVPSAGNGGSLDDISLCHFLQLHADLRLSQKNKINVDSSALTTSPVLLDAAKFNLQKHFASNITLLNFVDGNFKTFRFKLCFFNRAVDRQAEEFVSHLFSK